MTTSSTISYYLMIIGGSLTIMASIIILFAASGQAYYRLFIPTSNAFPLYFVLALLPGLVTLWLSQRFLARPEAEIRSAVAVALLSIVSLYAVMFGDAFLYDGIFYSGPPIAFTGSLLGAMSSRASRSATQPDSTGP